MTTVALVGAGVMGQTLLQGWLRSGWDPARLIATARRPEHAEQLRALGVRVEPVADAVAAADTIVVGVKPQDVADALAEIGPALRPGTVVVSIAAGVPTDLLEDRLPPGTPVVRAMPNTPAKVDEGMAAVSAGASAKPEHVQRAVDLLGATSRTVVVPERYQDAVTAISGSGPAYLFFVVESMIDAGVLLGLPRDTATQLVVQTMLGSATLLRESGEHPTVLRENVTSPGGTTAAALRELERNNVRAAFIAAMEAARDRSETLADGARRRAREA